MRKKLSVLMTTIMVLTLMAAGPAPAQVEPEPTVTVCALVSFILALPGEGPEFFEEGQTAEFSADIAAFLIERGLVAEGPCGGGGDNGGGDNGGGDNGGGGGGSGGQQGGGGVEITQEGEQESESGEIDQSFDVS